MINRIINIFIILKIKNYAHDCIKCLTSSNKAQSVSRLKFLFIGIRAKTPFIGYICNHYSLKFLIFYRFVEKGNLEVLLFTLQSKMRANNQKPYTPKEGKMISDINKAWERLEKAEHERLVIYLFLNFLTFIFLFFKKFKCLFFI